MSGKELKYSEKTCPIAASSLRYPTRTDLGWNPGHSGGKPAINRQSLLFMTNVLVVGGIRYILQQCLVHKLTLASHNSARN
jgi:hypothetical protein